MLGHDVLESGAHLILRTADKCFQPHSLNNISDIVISLCDNIQEDNFRFFMVKNLYCYKSAVSM